MSIETFIEIADRAFNRNLLGIPDTMKVGEYYERLPQETKDKIKQLSSDDFANVRFDAIAHMCFEPEFYRIGHPRRRS